ncbi:MAG: hypothetical protein AAGF68_00105 [Pseudomonadota bacterium]
MSPLIHIGYHKTATTWMQAQLFTPAHGYRMLVDHPEIFAHITRPHGLVFDPAPMRALIAERSAGLPEGHVAVLSSEIISGHPFYGGQMSDTYAHRVKAIAPEAKILVSIRSQQKILPSVYMQYLLRGGTMPYDMFFAGTHEPGYLGFDALHFEYDRLVGLYQQLFGAENVYVMTQESLIADMDGACLGVARFAGNTVFDGISEAARKARGVSYPEYAVGALRRVNQVQRSTLNPAPILALGETPGGLYRGIGYVMKRPPFRTLLAGRKPVSDYVKQHFSGHFATSNARLAATLAHPIDLSRYDLSRTAQAAE